MNTFLTVLCIVITVALSEASPWKDCGSAEGKIKSVSVSGCSDGGESCELKRGTNITCSVTFQPSHDAKLVTSKVSGIIAGVKIPFPLPNSDACANSGLTCPLIGEKTYKYVVEIPVLKKYPEIKVVIEMSLIDNSEKAVICFALPAEIV